MDHFHGCRQNLLNMVAGTIAYMVIFVGDLPTVSAAGRNCTIRTKCEPGIALRVWEPVDNLSAGDIAARATVYMASMIYMFLGVSIVAERFMASIEVITSKEKQVVIKKADGETTVINVRIWNETVSNLTLMALGSSAPEILLSIIEVVGNNFEPGQLGPSTIVGSAAFNLFIIIAICIYCIPTGEIRRIKHLRVFFITASWSIFAYLWLYFIISVTSIGVIQVWEGLLTLAFFPLTVVTAYIADKQIFFHRFLSKRYRTSTTKNVVVQCEDLEMSDGKVNHITDLDIGKHESTQEVYDFEQHRKEYIEILRELRKKFPNIDMKTLEERAEYEAVNRGPKSRAFYRIQATKMLTGGGKVLKKNKSDLKKIAEDEVAIDNTVTNVFFDPGHYTVMENVGTFQVNVTREGGDITKPAYVDFRTEDGTATAGDDYVYTEGTLTFHAHEKHKQFEVTILDDDIFEEDEHFYVKLFNARVSDELGRFENEAFEMTSVIQLANPFIATVMILDDDHPGIFLFDEPEVSVNESCGTAAIKVTRSSGARGMVSLPYWTTDGTAIAGKDYEGSHGEIIFSNDESEKYVNIRIMDDEEYEKDECFYLEIGQPQLIKVGAARSKSPMIIEGIAESAMPRLGEQTKICIQIRESQEFKSVVDKLLKKANMSLVVGTSSWREQFIDAITVSAGGNDDDDEDSEEKLPSCLDYVMHFLTIFWKILFACLPPTDIWGGWACFFWSIFFIGVLTLFIGDLASHFGCTIGLQDSVTAISFVALGTSIPDTFASKVAAIGDKYADSSIGNVTGSNAVNVFLGIGVAWSMAAIYQAIVGGEFSVKSGSLAFSVTIFCLFAVIAFVLLVLRRRPKIGGELGGPVGYKMVTVLVFVTLWFLYIILSSLVAYCIIPGF